MASQEELAELERLSAQYQPEKKGPLLGERISSEALVREYAEADPTYVTKTEALQKTYPFYRTVLGDGNCGWRALPFGLFERILATASPTRLIQESSRLESLNDTLTQAGVDKEVYADFVDPTFELLQLLARLVAEGKIDGAEKKLEESFNDPEIGNAVIMHFRLIASAHLKLNALDYAPFLVDSPDIPTYCATHIDPFATEIEQLGIQALSDAVFEPARIGFEILYLDRSEGDEVTKHEGGKLSGEEEREVGGDDETEGKKVTGRVRLLYRPGHYDLIYKSEDVRT